MLKLLNKLKLTDLLICFTFILIVSFLFLSYTLFFLILFTLSGAFFSFSYYKNRREALDKKAFNFGAILLLFIGFCTIVVLLKNILEVNLFAAIFLILISLALCAASVYFAINFKTIDYKFFNKQNLIRFSPFIIIAIVTLISILPLFKLFPLFDEMDYYDNLVVDINLKTINNIDKLKICGHMTHFWTILVYVAFCLTGDFYSGSALTCAILLIISMPIVYKMVKIICPNCSHWFALLCSCVFALSPFTFGFIPYMFSQTIMTYTILFFVYALVSKNKLLILLNATLLMFTFETCIFITAALSFVFVASTLIKALINKNLISEIKNISVLSVFLFLMHVVWLVVFSDRNWGGIGQNSTGAGLLSYEFNKDLYINFTLLVNFNWIIYLIIFASIIKLVIKKECIKNIKNENLIMLIVAYLACLTVSSFVVTFNYVRYAMPIYACSYFLFFYSINYLLKDIKIQNTKRIISHSSLIFLSLLLFIQSYFTIDPFMLSASEKTYMGSGYNYLVNPAYRSMRDVPLNIIGVWNYYDPYVYNRQFVNLQLAFDKALASIDYDISKFLVTNYDMVNQNILDGEYYTVGYPFSARPFFHAFDKEKKMRYITYDKEEAIRYSIKLNADSIKSLLEQRKYEEYWFIDYNSGIGRSIQYFADKNANIKIGESKNVSYFGWKFTLTKISLN